MNKSESNKNDEREFLHSLSTPISTALLLVDSLRDRLKSREDAHDEQTELAKIYDVLEETAQLLHDRREVLIARGAPGTHS